MITLHDIEPEFASITNEGLARGDRAESERALRIIERALSKIASEEGRCAATHEASLRRIAEIENEAKKNPRLGTASIPELIAIKEETERQIAGHLGDPRLTGASGA